MSSALNSIAALARFGRCVRPFHEACKQKAVELTKIQIAVDLCAGTKAEPWPSPAARFDLGVSISCYFCKVLY